MKIAFVVHVEYSTTRVLDILDTVGIDYYTRWDQVKGKGQGTDPHLGAGGYPSTNSVVMIAFEDEQPLARLIAAIETANADIKRAADHIRLFQLPLERIV